MEFDNFIKNFVDAVEIEEVSGISKDTKFRELSEWDSLSYLSVIAMMDEEYDTQIEGPEFKKLQTINDIYQYIKDHR